MTVEFARGETIEPRFEFIGFRKEITPHLECSELNITFYCPNCGARMKEADNETD